MKHNGTAEFLNGLDPCERGGATANAFLVRGLKF